MSEKEFAISHPGIVQKVEGEKVFVRILAQSACASCHVKGMCSLAEMKEKIVEVGNPGNKKYSPGDKVNISMEKSLGNRAVLWAYVLPFLLVLATLITVLLISENEGLAGLVALLTVVPYYIVLYLLRDKLQRTFIFRIR